MAKCARTLQLGKYPRPPDGVLVLRNQPLGEVLVEPLEPRGNAALSRRGARRDDVRTRRRKRNSRHGGRPRALLDQDTCLKQVQDADVANVWLGGIGVIADDGLDIVSAN